MAVKPAAGLLLQLRNKKSVTGLSRQPWRTRTKPKRREFTAVQKQHHAALRKQRNTRFKEALAQIHKDLYGAALRLREEFGQHTAAHYHRLIMQQSSSKQRKRRTSQWDAFVSIETKRHNAGRYKNFM